MKRRQYPMGTRQMRNQRRVSRLKDITTIIGLIICYTDCFAVAIAVIVLALGASVNIQSVILLWWGFLIIGLLLWLLGSL